MTIRGLQEPYSVKTLTSTNPYFLIWICDGIILLTGSVNMTHNGMTNNAEQLWRMRGPQVIESAMADFERLWDKGEEVESSHIDKMNEDHFAKYGPPRARSAELTVKRRLAGAFGRSKKAEPLPAQLTGC